MKKTALAGMAGFMIVTSPVHAAGEQPQPYLPGLAEFMITVQSHHAKLWFAGHGKTGTLQTINSTN